MKNFLNRDRDGREARESSRQDRSNENAANQICAIAQLRSERLMLGALNPGRRARGLALALGYYLPPYEGFQFAASPTNGNRPMMIRKMASRDVGFVVPMRALAAPAGPLANSAALV
jgi:hypothetical protein